MATVSAGGRSSRRPKASKQLLRERSPRRARRSSWTEAYIEGEGRMVVNEEDEDKEQEGILVHARKALTGEPFATCRVSRGVTVEVLRAGLQQAAGPCYQDTDVTIRILHGSVALALSDRFDPPGTEVEVDVVLQRRLLLITACMDWTLSTWDVWDGNWLRCSSSPQGSVLCVTVAGDGSVAAGSADHKVYLWIASPVCSYRDELSGCRGAVQCLAFSPEDSHLAAGSGDKTIRIWKMDNFRSYFLMLEGHRGSVEGAAFTPNGEILASASRDRTVRLWDWMQSNVLAELTGHAGDVNSVAFSTDAQLATASGDGTARVWSAESADSNWRCQHILRKHQGRVFSAAFAPEGAQVATCGEDGKVMLWDAKSGEHLAILDEGLAAAPGPAYSICFSADGMLLAVGHRENIAKVWDITAKQVVMRTSQASDQHFGSIQGVAFRWASTFS